MLIKSNTWAWCSFKIRLKLNQHSGRNWQEAEANTINSIAIGNGAKVEDNARFNSFSNGSEAKAKKLHDQVLLINGKNVKFAFKGGISNDANDKKTVFSIGKSGTERKIKNVAAGDGNTKFNRCNKCEVSYMQ